MRKTPVGAEGVAPAPEICGVKKPSSAAEALPSHSVQSHPTTFVGKLLVVKGELSGNEALVVDGEVEGPITLHGQRLTVRPKGRIRGNIEARHVILQGRVEGDIRSEEHTSELQSPCNLVC